MKSGDPRKRRRALIATTSVMLALVAACSSGDLLVGEVRSTAAIGTDGGDADAVARADAQLDDGAVSDVDAGAPCVGKASQPLDRTLSLMLGGQLRTADVHVPAAYAPGHRTALVFDFHDVTMSPSSEDSITGMNAKADAIGFVSVHPAGVGATWNGGACCGQAASSNTDDVGFVSAMIDALDADLCLDRNRIFATGIGNGGFLVERLACELAGRIASVASVAGPLGITTCKPSRPIAVLEIHGTSDTVFPYNGSSALGYPPVMTVFTDWAARDTCTGPTVETFRNIDAHCATYDTCAASTIVTQCTIDNGGHTWPGSTAPTVGGYVSPNLKATDIVWQFFAAHPMP